MTEGSSIAFAKPLFLLNISKVIVDNAKQWRYVGEKLWSFTLIFVNIHLKEVNIGRSVNNPLFNKTTSEAAWSLVTLVKRPLYRYPYTAAESLHASKSIRRDSRSMRINFSGSYFSGTRRIYQSVQMKFTKFDFLRISYRFGFDCLSARISLKRELGIEFFN